MRQSNYTWKTVVNRLLAIERWIGFVAENIRTLANKKLTLMSKCKRFDTKIEKTSEWITSQIKICSPQAAKDTKARNSREVLVEQNKWATAMEIFQKYKDLQEEHLTLLKCEQK